MRKLLVLLFLIVSSNLFANFGANELLQKGNSENYFIENQGQWSQEVKYLVKINGMNAWITDAGVVYDYYKIERNYSEENLLKIPENEKERYKSENSSVKGHVVKSLFKNNNSSQQFVGNIEQDGYYNYLLGNDKSKWASNIRLYKGATVKELYNGIDIKYYFDKGLLRYDYIVKPGADISQINIELEGVENYSINKAGELEIETSLGIVKHQDILAYQENRNGKRQIVKTLFKKTESGTIGFAIENYNKEKELIIDPLVYSTFLGAGSNDIGKSLKVDKDGNVIIAGYTSSTNFPTTSGAYQTSISTIHDIFITKLNSDGTDLVYSTFLGGSGNEKASSSLVIDNDGNAYISGFTDSRDFPTTSGAYDTTRWDTDAFITKLNADGTALVFSTYFGGSKYEGGSSLALDNAGNVFIAGTTSSTNLPTTDGAFQTTFGGKGSGHGDVFVAKLNSDGSALVFCTYLGGEYEDYSPSLVIDSNGNAIVSGATKSSNFPTTDGAFQTSIANEYNTDAFVTKLNSDGTALVYSTYLGGGKADRAYALQIDSENNTYIAGTTSSTNFPTTSGAFQTSKGSYLYAFLTKLNSNGTALIYSTFLGGDGRDYIYSIAIDNNKNAFVTGKTKSSNFPTTDGVFQTSASNTKYEAFVTGLNATGSALIYSTYLGGNNEDYAYSIALDSGGNIFVAGETKSSDFPITSGVYRTDLGDDRYVDAFITKIQPTLTDVELLENVIPTEYVLEQNYPNPFNPTTVISYKIPTASHVSIKVFDILGNTITTLINQNQAVGSYKVSFNASALSNGVYFYKINVGEFTSVKKMLLLK